jgi:16S rRNA (uracil1498-N3)-methyltransferase
VRVPRIYVPIALNPDAHVELDENSAHHVRDVLRLRKGNPLQIFNGEGNEYAAVLTLVSKKSVVLVVGSESHRNTESRLPIYFGLAISRGERMDFAIQKSVELGVSVICPLLTERCVVKLDGHRSAQKQLHWQRIATNASEQSGRVRVPEIQRPVSLSSWLEDASGLKIFLDPSSRQSLAMLSEPQCVYLLSGPEGGFTGHERDRAISAGFIAVNIGPRILRTETAALAGITLIQALWGDLCIRNQDLPDRPGNPAINKFQ